MGTGQYKDVVLGLVFLKYVSDAFEERRDAIRAELAGEDPDYLADTLEEADEYLGEGVFWVAPEARWDYISANAKGIPATATRDAQSIGEIIDHAMRTISSDNRALAGTLPTMFGRDNIDQRRLGELVDLFNSARFTGEGATKARDLLGEVYEYFLDKFAKAEGKRGGEFYTPPSLSKPWWRSLNQMRAAFTTPAAVPAACLFRLKSSSPATIKTPPRSPCTAKNSMSRPGAWRR